MSLAESYFWLLIALGTVPGMLIGAAIVGVCWWIWG